ncbi:MAG: hypothetical protein IKX51_09195 [Bacteroidales bacterium]|nr:hypothetical protein [Bacteroidales bacterium]
MAEKKDQYIVAYIADYNNTDTVLSYSLMLSLYLRKGIILLRVCDPKYTDETTDDAEEKIKVLRQRLPDNVFSTYIVLKGKTADVIELLPKAFNAVAIAGAVDKSDKKSPCHPKNLLRDFAKCKVAYLLAQEPPSDYASVVGKVAFALDFKKESKDKLIWASYFPRFFGSQLWVLSYNYTDEFLRNKWYSNMKFMDKMYKNLQVTYQKADLGKPKSFIDVVALDVARQLGIGLLICTTTAEKDVMEYFIGVQEERTIVNEHKIPILFLNPRDDLYVLCD